MKLELKEPEEECEDAKCAHHGSIPLRGRIFTGTVISDRMRNTVTVEWKRRKNYPKYERYSKTTSNVKAHNPPCMAAKEGQKVKIAETRRLSKTKTFVVVDVLEESGEETIEEKKSKQREEAYEDKEESEEGTEVEKEESDEESVDIPSESEVRGLTKDEMKEFASDEFGIELSTNDLKDEMVEQFMEELEEQYGDT